MFGTKTLIEKLNTAINSGTLSEIEIAQAFGAIESLENHPISSVSTTVDLPNPVVNKGRFIWIEGERRYVYSNGVSWDVNSIIQIPYVNVWTWGNNTDGRLGDNTIVVKSSPVSIAGNITDWIQVNAGERNVLGIRANGTAWGWGSGLSGVIGDNTLTNRSSPVSVVGGFTDWIQINCGVNNGSGIRANGTAWSWGAGTSGQLGDGTVVNKLSPVSVAGGFTDWIQINVAFQHGVGLRANGTAWAWGSNNYGQLGDGTSVSKSSPVSITGGFTDWIQISTFLRHSLAVRANGTAWGWGNNTYGQLGDNTTLVKSSPVSVVGGFTDWIQVSAGSSHSLGLRSNGTAWAWGQGTSGQLGDSTATAKSSPVSVVGGFTDWVQLSANGPSFGLRANGTAWSWGGNQFNAGGVLGDGTIVNKSSPVSVVGGFTDWTQISAGRYHGVGLRG